jgi:hypothetical protein
MKPAAASIIAAFLLCAAGWHAGLGAKDFGLIIDQTPGYESSEGFDNPGLEKFTLNGTVRPWFSTPLGEKADLYLSAGASIRYEKKEFTLAPEIFHTEFTFRPNEGQALKVGRIYYADPLGFIAEGLFDGLSWETPLGTGDFSVGAYYTGFLYKRDAYITLSKDELASYDAPLEYGDFLGSYFAPRRALAAVGYSNLLGESLRFNLALLGQIDLRGAQDYYTSEYLVFKFTLPYKSIFVFDAGGTAELIETSGQGVQVSFAGELNFAWMPPTPLQDRVSLGARYSAGAWDGIPLAEFRPLTTESQGRVLRAKLSGLSVIEAGYRARLNTALALDLGLAYFIQNDLGSYQGIFASTEAYFLGGEAYAQLIWSPLADFSFTLGGGAFLPVLGNTSPGSKPLWLVNLNIIFALF